MNCPLRIICFCWFWCGFHSSAFLAGAENQYLRLFQKHTSIAEDDGPVHKSGIVNSLDPRLDFGGRWITKDFRGEVVKSADWPCSYIRFDVNVEQEGADLTLLWYGVHTRIRVSVARGDELLSEQVLKGPGLINSRMSSPITLLEKGRLTVTIQKITTSCPYGPGIGGEVMGGSKIDFVGLEHAEDSKLSVMKSWTQSRKIVAIGASDTAGWCVDGTPSTPPLDFAIAGWKYEDCGRTFEALLADRFNTSLSVQAISGIGLTQNAQAKMPWVLGSRTMPEYFNRTLQETGKYKWNFTDDGNVDLVILSLGGNDYNHQKGLVPSDAAFSTKYAAFLKFLFNVYDKNTKILSICGMGDPHEKERDPDNNRCRPCPHVEAAVKHFVTTYPDQADRLFYKFIPCDGSVVQGTNDIGCNGHKNELGQERVANFLAPVISNITGWK